MTRHWKLYGLSFALAAAMVAAPSAPASDDKNTDGTPKTPAEQLAEQIKKLNDALGRLEGIEKNLRDTQTENALKVNNLQRDLSDLQKRFDKLEQQLAAAGNRTTSLRVNDQVPGPVQPIGAIAGNMGRLRIVNTHPFRVSVVINNEGPAHRVESGEVRDFSIPIGPFRYQILGVHAEPLQRQMSANEILNVNVR